MMRNQILLADCTEGLRTLPDASIPMTLTSPPYGNLRAFGGHEWSPDIFERIAEELFRVTMPGGVVVWVVGDQIVGGSLTGDSFRHAIFLQEIGFSLHQILIMRSSGFRLPDRSRYPCRTQFAFVMSKGHPRSVHLIRDRPNATAGRRWRAKYWRSEGGARMKSPLPERVIGAFGRRDDVWEYVTGGVHTTQDGYAYEHSALMPEAFARDLILSWSRPGDLVLDPMCGAGTSCKMALLSHRDYLGFEVHEPYHRIAERRMNDAHAEYRRRLDDWLVAGPSPGLRFRRPEGGYEVIYADPPWPYKSWGRSTSGMHAEDHYRTMPMEDIMALPVGDLAAWDSVLLLWTTGPFLDEAVRTIEAWGFDYKTIAFNWVKTRGGTIHTGLGYHTRSNSEICLLATRGKGLPRARSDVHQVVISEVMKHSEKPEAVRRRIEALYGPRRRLELFARTQASGWDALGDAIDGRDIRDSIGARPPEPRMQPLQWVC